MSQRIWRNDRRSPQFHCRRAGDVSNGGVDSASSQERAAK
jgi:hypothetical protein